MLNHAIHTDSAITFRVEPAITGGAPVGSNIMRTQQKAVRPRTCNLNSAV